MTPTIQRLRSAEPNDPEYGTQEARDVIPLKLSDRGHLMMTCDDHDKRHKTDEPAAVLDAKTKPALHGQRVGTNMLSFCDTEVPPLDTRVKYECLFGWDPMDEQFKSCIRPFLGQREDVDQGEHFLSITKGDTILIKPRSAYPDDLGMPHGRSYGWC